MKTFADLGLKEEILQAVAELGFETPTPIQEKVIPILLDTEKDVVGLAQTGTGKTAGFGLPSLHKIDPQNRSIQAFILSPTRELCMQISSDIKNFAKYLKGVRVATVYGGSSIEKQIKEIKGNPQVVVATPGRAKDLIQRRVLNLENIEISVLDEADEMLTMGFKEDLNYIFSKMPDSRQTLLFSATMSAEIRSISKKYMGDSEEVSVGKENTASRNVEHHYYRVHARDQYEVLKRIADLNPDIYGIVFCRTRNDTKDVARKLRHDHYNADALHGDLSQAQRTDIMQKFRDKHIKLLVATDVAARGLDIDNLTHVINYNLPDDIELYVHRSGRTGRAGKQGISIAITHTREGSRVKAIEKIAGVKFELKNVPTGREVCEAQLFSFMDKVTSVNVDDRKIEPFLDDIYQKFEHLNRDELIKHFVSVEFNRFLSDYKNASTIQTQSATKNQDRNYRDKVSREKKSNFKRLFINVGTQNGLNPTKVIGIVGDVLDHHRFKMGKIDILRNFSFFEVEDRYANELIESSPDFQFEGVNLSIEASKEKKTFSADYEDKLGRGGRDRSRSDRPRGDRSKGGRRKK
jgi:ATP-dependent RNA helicase DeaD